MARARQRYVVFRFLVFSALICATGAFFIWLLVLSGGVPSPSGLHYKVSAVVSEAGAQLVPGARVTMAGVQVGEVDGVSRDGGDAIISMTIEHSGVTPLPTDTRALVRTRTPLGEDYVQLTPGSAHTTMKSGGVIPLSQDDPLVDVDQVLSVFQGPARDRARELIQGLGGAVNGRGDQLNAMIGNAGGVISGGSQISDTLVGQREQISQLIDQTGRLTASIGTQGDEIRQLADGGLTTFDAIAARDRALSALIKILPTTMSTVRSTTGRLTSVSRTAAPVLFNLAATLDAAQPAARDLAPATSQLHQVVDDLGTASPPLTSTLTALRRISPAAVQTLPQVHQLLCQLHPMLDYAEPYTEDLMATITELGSASNTYDATGHTILLSPAEDEDAVVGLSGAQSTALQTLLHSGFLSKVNGLTYDPFPGPGQANDTSADLPDVAGPAQLKAVTGYTYPHITPSC